MPNMHNKSYLIALWVEDIAAYLILKKDDTEIIIITPATQVYSACIQRGYPVIFAEDHLNVRPSNNGFHSSSGDLARRLSLKLSSKARDLGVEAYQPNWIYYILDWSFKLTNRLYFEYLTILISQYIPSGSKIYIKSSNLPTFLANDPFELKSYITRFLSKENQVIIYQHPPIITHYSWREVFPLDLNVSPTDRAVIFAPGPIQKPNHLNWMYFNGINFAETLTLESLTYANSITVGSKVALSNIRFEALDVRYRLFGNEMAACLTDSYNEIEEMNLGQISQEFYKSYFAVQAGNYDNLEQLFKTGKVRTAIIGDICTGYSGILHSLCTKFNCDIHVLPHDTHHVIARNRTLFPNAKFNGSFPTFFYNQSNNRSIEDIVKQEEISDDTSNRDLLHSSESHHSSTYQLQDDLNTRTNLKGINILRRTLSLPKQSRSIMSALLLLNDFDLHGLCPGYSLSTFCNSLVHFIKKLREADFLVSVRAKPSISSSKLIFEQYADRFQMRDGIDFSFTSDASLDLIYQSKSFDLYYSHFGPTSSLQYSLFRDKPLGTLFCGHFYDADDASFDDCAMFDQNRNIVFFKPDMLFLL